VHGSENLLHLVSIGVSLLATLERGGSDGKRGSDYHNKHYYVNNSIYIALFLHNL
jgi:hypothetical protein